VKKKIVSLGSNFWLESPDGARLGEVKGKVVVVRPAFEIYDTQGQLLAVVKKKMLRLLGSEWWLENAFGQEVARIKGVSIVLLSEHFVRRPSTLSSFHCYGC